MPGENNAFVRTKQGVILMELGDSIFWLSVAINFCCDLGMVMVFWGC